MRVKSTSPITNHLDTKNIISILFIHRYESNDTSRSGSSLLHHLSKFYDGYGLHDFL